MEEGKKVGREEKVEKGGIILKRREREEREEKDFKVGNCRAVRERERERERKKKEKNIRKL